MPAPDCPSSLKLGIATKRVDREAVFCLRYRAYLNVGAIDENRAGSFTDAYDELATTVLFLVRDENSTPVGSLRFSAQPPGPTAVPSCPEISVFSDILAPLTNNKRPIISGTRFSILPSYHRRGSVALLLLLAQAKAAKAVNGKWAIATATGRHRALYERLLTMKPKGESRFMPGLKFRYNLLIGDLDRGYRACLNRFPLQLRERFRKDNSNWEHAVRQALVAMQENPL